MSKERLHKLLQFLESSPGDSFLSFAVAKEYESAGDEERALEYYQRLTEQDPDYVGAYYHLGKLYERRRQYEKARQTYERGMEAAKRAGDRHALSELAGARLALEEEE